MIVLPAPPLPPAEAARRAGAGRLPAWLRAPGPAGDQDGGGPSFVASDPVDVVRGASLDQLDAAWQRARAAWSAGKGVPVGIGYLGYDLGRRLEPKVGLKPKPCVASRLPPLEFRFYDALWVDPGTGGDAAFWAVDEAAAQRLAARLGAAPPPAFFAETQLGPLAPIEPAERHVEGVRRVLAYIRAGDVYQVNLARRLRAEVRGAARPTGLSLAVRLARDAPAPFSIWLADDDDADGWAIVGNSPERFLSKSVDGSLETQPIKGTRPRGGSPDEDARAMAVLAADPKDRAEHAMIVDLERNDLGRVCEIGSVAPSDLFRIVSLPTVHHLVSTVRGRLRAGVSLPALLRATFPGGSITGAPKIRAMQIIDELEPACRGPYTGATGWLGAAGDLDLAVAIRTAVLEGGALTVWAGGGVVADSQPEAELAETIVKAEAFARLSR